MFTYTTCPGCHEPHIVSYPGDIAHEHCHVPGAQGLGRVLVEAIMRGDRQAEADYTRQLDAIDDAPPRLLDAALIYASWGWPVFPCRPGGKAPAYHRGEFEHGVRQASVDPDQIRAWWTRWPTANIGLATGWVMDVIDVDPAGRLWWADLYAHHNGNKDSGLPDVHGIVSTPRPGGSHIYIQPSGKGNLADFAPGVDYRGRGGYVLAPPSVLHPSVYLDQGKPVPDVRHLNYTWTVYPSPMLKPAIVPAHDCLTDSCGGWRDDPPCGGCCTCLGYCQHEGLPDDMARGR